MFCVLKSGREGGREGGRGEGGGGRGEGGGEGGREGGSLSAVNRFSDLISPLNDRRQKSATRDGLVIPRARLCT